MIREWRAVPNSIEREWRRLFNAAAAGGMEVPGACPLCNAHALNQWYVLDAVSPRSIRGIEYAGTGRLWEWCSSCFIYEALPDGFVPVWWKPPFDLELPRVFMTPDRIEEARIGFFSL